MATSTAKATATDGGKKKASRPNPTRRKAAKLKGSVQDQQPLDNAVAVAVSPVGSPSEHQRQSKVPSNPGPAQAGAKAEPKLPVSATLSRQSTQPVTTVQKRPNPPRSNTVPTPSANHTANLALSGPAIVTGGLLGCAASAAILLGVGIWYDFSGAESAILTAKAAKLCVDNLAEELITALKAGTYSSDEAVDILRRTTLAYASTIPGGARWVERVFQELDMVRKQRGKEVDQVVAETYEELSKAARKGANEVEMRRIVLKQLAKLSTFAGKASKDVVARNPALQPWRQGARKALLGSDVESEGGSVKGTPTVRLNMVVRQKTGKGIL